MTDTSDMPETSRAYVERLERAAGRTGGGPRAGQLTFRVPSTPRNDRGGG